MRGARNHRIVECSGRIPLRLCFSPLMHLPQPRLGMTAGVLVKSRCLPAEYGNAIRTLMQVPYEPSPVYTPRSFLDAHCNSTIHDAQRY
ncbi:hypothetical protein IG631_05565 [Alternaria alternata]|nr:hypothetical protein IG631_05565 [Alternaria alternata]